MKRFDVENNKNTININFTYDSVKLGDIAKFQYGLGEIAQDIGNIPYIRITDIDRFGQLKKNSLKYIDEQDNFSSSILNKGDILVARTGATYGKTLYFNEDFRATFGGFLIRITLNTEIILPKYYFYFTHLNIYWINAKKLVGGGGQPQFNANAVKQLNIPIPPIKIQNEIIEIMDNALNQKEIKENESKILLENINDFILGELGIEYEEVEEKKVFGIMLSELGETKRFDVEINKQKNKFLTKHDLVKIGSIAKLKAGGTPRRGKEAFWKNGNINWLKSGELKDSLNIIEIEEKITEEGLKKSSATLFKKGTLLIAMYGVTAGEVGILGVDSTTNQAVCSIIGNEKINNEYLFLILKFLRKKIRSETFGGAQPNISKTYLENLEIPLPSLDIQEKIAIEVKERIEKANTLKGEAKEVYEKAKKKVEDMILVK